MNNLENDCFRWCTDYPHMDNADTMTEYLDSYLPDDARFILQDGSYAEVVMDGQRYALDAKGDGDCYHHIVNIAPIPMPMDNYVGTQTPIERLRNKLTPFLTLVDLLSREDSVVLPFIEHRENGPAMNELFESLLSVCKESTKDISVHLNDCEEFYVKKDDVGHDVNLPTKRVCFFKIEDGKYVTDNGIEITTDMLVKHSHYIGFPWNYIVME